MNTGNANIGPLLTGLLLVACSATLAFGAEPRPDVDDDLKPPGVAERHQPEPEAGILYSISQVGRDYTVELVHAPGAGRDLTVRLVKDGKVAFSFVGHFGTVFVIRGAALFYADFSDIGSGCTLIAVDLVTGRELWRNQLRGLGPVMHSKYANQVRLIDSPDGLVVAGHEGYGDYVEVVHRDTGRTLSNRVVKERR